ncbi:MAG: uL15 family ribosomal protein [Candidatus Niyogibacteria bacterium]|nr:uL15 family ribosomal protein [Candidatus Niyogibacteria bacterium]
MQFHQLQSPQRKRKRRIGRGGKRGTYSGKGMKGQKSRAGGKLRPQLRDTIKKFPKKRGVKTRGFHTQGRPHNVAEVQLRTLEKIMKAGETVTPKLLAQKGVIQVRGGKMPEVKLLGSLTLAKKLLIQDCQISKGARFAIEKAGGKVIEKSEV